MSNEYQSRINYTGKPVTWYVDLACMHIEAMTDEEAIQKAETIMREETLPEIAEVSLVEIQKRIPIKKANTWKGGKR